MSKQSHPASSVTHPTIGTLIDGDSLELVEVLGVGGYGVVYGAVDAFSSNPRSYAVKCLVRAPGQSNARRQLHIREMTLHQIASAHPGVVTLHRVVEEGDYTFIIMDYAFDHDLFTQILHKCRYLGDDALIKHVFLQILDAVEYCHSLGIYHRDLKPENILCFDHGYRVAITDFGLATTEKLSEEYRTGSVYHMSPECQNGDSEGIPYSPLHNDIWSLGIVLLNLTTGRNPWRSATLEDPTFEAYKRDPLHFLPGVLPISDELNDVLVQTLDLDWRSRISLSELREAVECLPSFYSSDVVFEGNLARCPKEVGVDLGNGTGKTSPVNKRQVPKVPEGIEPFCVVSMSGANFTYRSPTPSIIDHFEEKILWGTRSECDGRQDVMEFYDEVESIPYEPSERSCSSSDRSSPATPGDVDEYCSHNFTRVRLGSDEAYADHGYGDMGHNVSPATSIDEDDGCSRFPSSVFLATPKSGQQPPFPDLSSAAAYRYRFEPEKRKVGVPGSLYSRLFSDSESEESQYPYDIDVDHIIATSPAVPDFPEDQIPRRATQPIDIRGGRGRREKAKDPGLFNSIKFLPRSPRSSWLSPKTSPMTQHPLASLKNRGHETDSPPSQLLYRDVYHRPTHARPVANLGSHVQPTDHGPGSQLRSSQDWF